MIILLYYVPRFLLIIFNLILDILNIIPYNESCKEGINYPSFGRTLTNFLLKRPNKEKTNRLKRKKTPYPTV